MTTEMVLAVGKDAIFTMLMAAAPILLAGLLVGLTISIFQAVTQINEMTLTFIPKIVAVALSMLLFLPYIINKIVDFTNRIYNIIPSL